MRKLSIFYTISKKYAIFQTIKTLAKTYTFSNSVKIFYQFPGGENPEPMFRTSVLVKIRSEIPTKKLSDNSHQSQNIHTKTLALSLCLSILSQVRNLTH